ALPEKMTPPREVANTPFSCRRELPPSKETLITTYIIRPAGLHTTAQTKDLSELAMPFGWGCLTGLVEKSDYLGVMLNARKTESTKWECRLDAQEGLLELV